MSKGRRRSVRPNGQSSVRPERPRESQGPTAPSPWVSVLSRALVAGYQ